MHSSQSYSAAQHTVITSSALPTISSKVKSMTKKLSHSRQDTPAMIITVERANQDKMGTLIVNMERSLPHIVPNG